MKKFLLGLFGSRDSLANSKGYHPVDRTSKVKYAIPLTIDEAGQLAEALARIHRTSHERAVAGTEITGGVIWAREMASDISRYVGAAKAHGYVHVPVPADRLNLLDHAMDMLLVQHPNSEDTRAFERLHARMHVLAGMAEACGWSIDPAAKPIAWFGSEPRPDTLGNSHSGDLERRG